MARTTTDDPKPARTIVDARGLKCPLPAIKAEKQAQKLSGGQRFTLYATDVMAKIDIPLFCQQNGLSCRMTEQDNLLTFEIRKP